MILITGSLAFDYVMDFPGKFADHIMPDKVHMLNVSFLVSQMQKGFGGTAGNIGYNLSLLGIECTILGAVGRDFSPYKEFLQRKGVDTSYIKVIENDFTSTAFGITDKSNNQIWGFYTGADESSESLSINTIKEKIKFGIIAPNKPKSMLKFARQYQNKNIPYLFDPGMQLPHLTSSDLKSAFAGAKIIIGNDYEVALMQKKTGIRDLHEKFGKDKIIITTLGEKGSHITAGKKSFKIKAAHIESILDPTGAGDAYRAGFIAGFIRGLDIPTCGQIGAVCAAYTVEKYGTQTHKFTREEFTQRYQENFGDKLSLSSRT